MRMHPSSFRRTSSVLALLAGLCALLSVCHISLAQASGASRAPLAGTAISNQAELSFRDTASGLPVRILTNTVRAFVSPVPDLELLQDRTLRVTAGATVDLPHTLRNTGNVRTAYRLDIANIAGDAFDLLNLHLVRDLNGNGRADSGEPLFSSSDTITLDPGQSAEFVIVGTVPAVPAERGARVRITATAAANPELSQTNFDTLQTVQGVAVNISKSVSPSQAQPNQTLDYTLTALSVGSVSPSPYAVTVDGGSARLVVVRDIMPANTRFESFLDSPADGLRLYHTAGAPEDSYTTSAPQDLSSVDAIALGLRDWGSPSRTVQLRFRTRVNGNASGEIVNIAHLRYANASQNGIVISAEAPSNATRVPIPPQAPTITYFTDSTYSNPAILTQAGEPLHIQVSSAACNLDPTKIERIRITITSRDTGDAETFDGIETGPNTGLFRPARPVPTQRSRAPKRGDGILQTIERDVLTATFTSCDGQPASTTIFVAPFGVAFDSRTDAPVAGAVVTIIDVNGTSNGGRRGQPALYTDAQGNRRPAVATTGSDGIFRFPLLPPGTYRVQIVPPSGYQFPSKIPPSLLPPERVIDPAGSYGRTFIIDGNGGPIAFDVPLDGPPPGGLFIEKEASAQVVEMGGFIEYRVRVRNAGSVAIQKVRVSDRLPRGFSFVRGSARLETTAASTSSSNTIKLPDPEGGAGPLLTFALGNLAPKGEATFVYRLRVGAGTSTGQAINAAQAMGTSPFGTSTSNTATATVQIISGVLTDRVVIIGKVFVDTNHNRIQDKGELGVPGVRVILEDGTYAVTDSQGKYSIYGLAARTHVVKLDTTTMPAGSHLEPLTQRHAKSGSSAFADVKAAELHKVNFAIIDATPQVLADIQKRRLTAERSPDEVTGLASSQLTIEPQTEGSQGDRRGLASSGTISPSRGGTLSSAPGGTLAVPAAPGTSDLDNTSLFTGAVTPGASVVANPSGALANRSSSTQRIQAPAVISSASASSSSASPGQSSTSANGGSASVPTSVERAVASSTLPDVPQVLAAPNGAAPAISSGTLSGDNDALGARRQNQENIPQGASKQPIREPLGAGNSNLPSAPVRVAPSVNYDALLPTLSNELGFVELRDGDTLASDQVTIRVKGQSGGKLQLLVNGAQVPQSRVGASSILESKSLEVREFVGIKLNEGPNTLRVVQLDSFGNKRGASTISVIAPGGLGILRVSVPRQAYADGRSIIKVGVQVLDRNGVLVSARTPLTLESSLGSWQVIDLNPIEPGVQVFVQGGQATFDLLPPLEAGNAQIRVTSGALGATARLSFVPELRPLIGAGLVEGRISNFKVNRVEGQNGPIGGNVFDEQLHSIGGQNSAVQGRSAAYFKGQVQGKYLLTLRYDTQTDKEGERLFRDIQPDEFYPVYGDSSLKGFDAQSTSRLYVRVDQNRSYILYGDYTTSSQSLARSLGEYQRSLTGAKTHFESDRLTVNAFAAHDNARQVVEEIPAQGISGPYLLSNGVLKSQSERVEIIVRDRNQPGIILSITPQTRFSDYTLDGLTDGLLFRSPVPSRDQNFNPVFIRVTYEVDQGGPNFFVGGADAQIRLGSQLAIGGSLIEDRNIADPFKLRALNAIYQIRPNTLAIAEYAQSDRRSKGSGNAGRFEFLHEGSRFQARLFAGRAARTFDNPSSLLSSGRQELAASATYALSDKDRLRFEALQSKDLLNGGSRRGAQISYEKSLSNNIRLELGIRNAHETAAPAQSTSPSASPSTSGLGNGGRISFTSLRARLSGQLPRVPNASVFTEYERALGTGNRQALSLGGQYQLANRTRLYAVHELISSLEGRYALNDLQQHNSTLIGIDTDYMKNGRLFSEYRISDAIDGRSAEAALGLRNLWSLAPGLRLGTSFERVRQLSGRTTSTAGNTTGALGTGNEGTAASLSLEYTPRPDLKATGRLEGRRGQDQHSYLGSFGVAYKASQSLTILGRDIFSATNSMQATSTLDAANRNQHRLQLGLSHRPVRNDKWNALAKYEFRNGQDPTTTFNSGMQRSVHILSADLNYQPSALTSLRLHYAWRKSAYKDDAFSDGLGSSSSAQLLSGRISRELGRRMEFDLFGGRLFDSGGGQWNIGGELSFQVTRDMLLSLGYNALGFSNDELMLDTYSRKGIYARLRFKFDEDLLSGGLSSEQRLANARPRSTVDANALNAGSAAPDVVGVPRNPGVVGKAPATSNNPGALPTGNSPAALDQAPGDDLVQEEAAPEAAVPASGAAPAASTSTSTSSSSSSSSSSVGHQEGAAK